jgi:hypothetical protein
MARSRPYKKDLTPIGSGGITKHTGKGATEQRGFGGSLTGGNPFERMGNRYPKASADDLAPPENDEPPPPVPQGAPPSRGPTAMMPGGGGDDDDE